MKKKVLFKYIRSLSIFMLIFIITFYVLLRNQNLNDIYHVTLSVDGKYIIAGILSMLMYIIVESINIKCLLKSFGDKITLLKMIKYTFICFFFNGITPAATGGQPMEIYYMKKEKIGVANSTISLLIQICCVLISTISLGIICTIINPSVLKDGLIYLFLLGVSINSLGLLLMLTCIFNEKLAIKIVNIFIKILKGFRVKNFEKKKDKIYETLDNYKESANFIKNHKIEFIKSIIRVYIQILFLYSIPYFVYKSFGFNEYNIFQIISMQAILYCTTSGLPLPGAMGITESVYLKIFMPIFGEGYIHSALLISRGINFYWFIIASAIIVLINSMAMKKHKK